MHDNPCRGKWNLVTDVTKYKHSSVKFYLCGEQGVYPVMNYLELEDIDFRLCWSSKRSTPNAEVGVSHQPHCCEAVA